MFSKDTSCTGSAEETVHGGGSGGGGGGGGGCGVKVKKETR